MADEECREPASDPQDLERLLVCRQRAGDVNGIVALYEPRCWASSRSRPAPDAVARADHAAPGLCDRLHGRLVRRARRQRLERRLVTRLRRRPPCR